MRISLSLFLSHQTILNIQVTRSFTHHGISVRLIMETGVGSGCRHVQQKSRFPIEWIRSGSSRGRAALKWAFGNTGMCGPAILRDSRDIKNSLFPFRPVIVRKWPECQIASADIAVAFRAKEWSRLARKYWKLRMIKCLGNNANP